VDIPSHDVALLDMAISEFDKAICIDPGCEEAYSLRGLARFAKGHAVGGEGKLAKEEYLRALADYSRAVELAPDKSENYQMRDAISAAIQSCTASAVSDFKDDGATDHADKGQKVLETR
jgi:tetratricopeptide (TPR) repeat protein